MNENVGPPSRAMKPKPLASLNHFTVPVMRAMTLPYSLSPREPTVFGVSEFWGKFCASICSVRTGPGISYAAPAALATYRAVLPQVRQRRVTCDIGAGGNCPGSRSMVPEQDGQLSAAPERSRLMR